MRNSRISSTLGITLLLAVFLGSLFWMMRFAELQDDAATRLIALLDLKIQEAFGYHDSSRPLKKF